MIYSVVYCLLSVNVERWRLKTVSRCITVQTAIDKGIDGFDGIPESCGN